MHASTPELIIVGGTLLAVTLIGIIFVYLGKRLTDKRAAAGIEIKQDVERILREQEDMTTDCRDRMIAEVWSSDMYNALSTDDFGMHHLPETIYFILMWLVIRNDPETGEVAKQLEQKPHKDTSWRYDQIYHHFTDFSYRTAYEMEDTMGERFKDLLTKIAAWQAVYDP